MDTAYLHKGVIKSNLWHQCAICHKTYSHKSNLKRHIRGTHEHRTFKCAICDAPFKRKEYLVRHLRNVHPTGSPTCVANSFSSTSIAVQTRRTHLPKMAANVHRSTNTPSVRMIDSGTGNSTTLVDRATSPIRWGNLHHTPNQEPMIEEYHTSTGNFWDQTGCTADQTDLTSEESPLPPHLSDSVLQDFFQDLNSLELDFSDFH